MDSIPRASLIVSASHLILQVLPYNWVAKETLQHDSKVTAVAFSPAGLCVAFPHCVADTALRVPLCAVCFATD